MRSHIGKHILGGEGKGKYPCGFCGRDCCSSSLVFTGNKKHGVKTTKAVSNCPYFIDFHKKPTTFSIRNPCTNYIVECILCKVFVWKYNLSNHYDDIHPEMTDKPEVEVKEKEGLLKLNI